MKKSRMSGWDPSLSATFMHEARQIGRSLDAVVQYARESGKIHLHADSFFFFILVKIEFRRMRKVKKNYVDEIMKQL